MAVKKLDQRIDDDLPQIYQSLTKQIVLKDIVENLEPIAAAKELSEKLFGGEGKVDDWFALSCYGLPGYFTGDRKAKTVMVMLNPGNDVLANDNPFNTMRYIRNYGISLKSEEEFIRTYKEGYRDFGKHPTYKVDNFDMKQAVFLSAWKEEHQTLDEQAKEMGVVIPKGFPDKLIENRGKNISASVRRLVDKFWQEYVQYLIDNKLRDAESRAAVYKEIVGKINASLELSETELQEVLELLEILSLKEKATRNVLTQKLQLELIPYASRTFDTTIKNYEPFYEYLETVLHEIFRTDRTYVIFCSRFFERLFKDYIQHKETDDFQIELKKEEIDFLDDPEKGEKKGMKISCTPVRITCKCKGNNRQPIVAIIAHTFPVQSLPNAYEKMQKYGAFCYKRWKEIEK